MKLFKEFREFIARGNVMDMAVGVIVGGAFTGIVDSLVNDLIMPLLGLLTGGMNFAALSVRIGPGEEDVLRYGAFIAAVINFLLIAAVLFLVIKALNSLHRKKHPIVDDRPTTQICPYCMSEIPLAATRCPHCTSELKK